MFSLLAGRGRAILSSSINTGAKKKNHIREGGGEGRRKDKNRKCWQREGKLKEEKVQEAKKKEKQERCKDWKK